MLTFITAPGVGDISWIVSKIYHMFSQREIGIKVSDGHPHRSKDYIDLLPGVKNLGYEPWAFPNGAIATDTDLDLLPDGEYHIQCNTILDAGGKLADIFPHQPTNYHYEMNISQEAKDEAKKFIDSIQGSPIIGLYCSSYNGYCPWSNEEWLEFCELLRGKYPTAAFYFIGAQYDDRTTDVYELVKSRGFNAVSGVGKYRIDISISILKNLGCFFAYPSGLAILCDVIRTPCMTWIYQSFPQGLIDSWPDPETVKSGEHIILPTTSVMDSFNIFAERMAQHVK